MVEPYKAVITFDDVQITSVVLDRNEFEIVVDSTFHMTNGEQRQQMKDAGTIPLIQRGKKTQYLFDKFETHTDYMCICNRGYGRNLALRAMGLPPNANEG